jgi:hypothetical protein
MLPLTSRRGSTSRQAGAGVTGHAENVLCESEVGRDAVKTDEFRQMEEGQGREGGSQRTPGEVPLEAARLGLQALMTLGVRCGQRIVRGPHDPLLVGEMVGELLDQEAGLVTGLQRISRPHGLGEAVEAGLKVPMRSVEVPKSRHHDRGHAVTVA